MRTLVLGGYGNFGARIVRALASSPPLELLIAGRDLARAESMAALLNGNPRAIAIDRTASDFAARLRDLGIDLLIHTAGPFQAQAYDVAAAAAAARAHYIDLADGRRFVCDFAASMDEPFRAAQRTAITGASTVPALSSAVIDHLCRDWARIDTIDLCIAPAQTAPRGEATIAAVLGYCGAPIQVWNDSRWETQRGWARPVRVQFERLRPRRGALCDIPDLELFPPRYRVTKRVTFRAALEVGLGQRVLALLAALRAAGLVRRPERCARLLDRSARWFDFLGSARGGMVVRVAGIDEGGRAAWRAWHITADDGTGPEIPCLAAILLARRLAQGAALPAGAHVCMGLLRLEEFEPEFARWRMVTDVIGGN